jgi:MYXO-CTERM domain-containing protein
MKKSNQLRRRQRAIFAAVSAVGVLAAAGSAPAAPLGTNLVVNGGFENVNLQSTGAYNGPQILDWTGMSAFSYSHDGSSSSAGVVPKYADGAPPPGAGHWYFTSNNAGPTTDINAPGQFFQNIDVSAGPTGAAIASGTARYDLSAFMSSYLDDTDIGNAHIDFLNSTGASLGTAVLSDPDFGPNNVWNLNSLSGSVPVGTSTLRVSVFGTRTAGGAGPDGYIDNVSLSITAVPEPGGLALAAGLLGLALVRRRRRDGP